MFSLKPKKDTCTTGCCTPQPKGKEACPLCGALAKGVLAKTVEHMLSDQAKLRLSFLRAFTTVKHLAVKLSILEMQRYSLKKS